MAVPSCFSIASRCTRLLLLRCGGTHRLLARLQRKCLPAACLCLLCGSLCALTGSIACLCGWDLPFTRCSGFLAAFCFICLLLRVSETQHNSLSLCETANGIIAGMVAVSACAGLVQPWAALVLGIAGAFRFMQTCGAVMPSSFPLLACTDQGGDGLLGLLLLVVCVRCC